jgi:hypothetical protein
MPLILALENLRQEEWEFEASLSKPYLKGKQNKTKIKPKEEEEEEKETIYNLTT